MQHREKILGALVITQNLCGYILVIFYTASISGTKLYSIEGLEG
jgi:hypothetical protein